MLVAPAVRPPDLLLDVFEDTLPLLDAVALLLLLHVEALTSAYQIHVLHVKPGVQVIVDHSSSLTCHQFKNLIQPIHIDGEALLLTERFP